MDNKDKLIRTCRYYGGEEECPFSTDDLYHYWYIERHYVDVNGILNIQESDYYDAIGGKNYTGIPRALLIDMFFVWGKGVYDKKAHLDGFYRMVDDYLEIPSEYIPVDKIPQ